MATLRRDRLLGVRRRRGRRADSGVPEPGATVLQITGVTARFGTHTALRRVDLTVAGGELVALAGEPGAGKTTLVRCVAGDLARPAALQRADGAEPGLAATCMRSATTRRRRGEPASTWRWCGRSASPSAA